MRRRSKGSYEFATRYSFRQWPNREIATAFMSGAPTTRISPVFFASTSMYPPNDTGPVGDRGLVMADAATTASTVSARTVILSISRSENLSSRSSPLMYMCALPGIRAFCPGPGLNRQYQPSACADEPIMHIITSNRNLIHTIHGGSGRYQADTTSNVAGTAIRFLLRWRLESHLEFFAPILCSLGR
jgi:hypothetical protein